MLRLKNISSLECFKEYNKGSEKQDAFLLKTDINLVPVDGFHEMQGTPCILM